MQAKTLPQISAIEINVIEEDVTRLLEFEAGALDFIVLGAEVANRLLSDGTLRPEYAARGIVRHVFPEPYLFSVIFNMNDAIVGGMGNAHVALRRAIALGLDRKTLIDVVYAGQGVPANQLVPPGVAGHDPSLPPSSYDPASANALLDRFGYQVRDADGYRMAPDGNPLTLTMSLRTAAISREVATLWKRNLDALGLRTDFRFAPFQELNKEIDAGEFQFCSGGYGGTPFGDGEMLQLDSRQPTTVNAARFALPEYDRAVDRFFASPDNEERIAAARRASALAATYAPLLPTIFRLENDFVQPWVQGYSAPLFTSYWKYLDIDLARRQVGR